MLGIADWFQAEVCGTSYAGSIPVTHPKEINMDAPNVKQIIAVRRDLKMRRGKEAAQVAHAAMKVFLNGIKFEEVEGEYVARS